MVTVAAQGVGASLPKQGTTIEAEATVGDVVRKFLFFKLAQVPSFLTLPS